MKYDYDYLIIGSGFGGSVSALRLAEKGYKVAVLESGKRFADADYAKETKEASKYYWFPQFGMKGIFRMTTVQGHLHRLGQRCGRRQPWLRQHPVSRHARVL